MPGTSPGTDLVLISIRTFLSILFRLSISWDLSKYTSVISPFFILLLEATLKIMTSRFSLTYTFSSPSTSRRGSSPTSPIYLSSDRLTSSDIESPVFRDNRCNSLCCFSVIVQFTLRINRIILKLKLGSNSRIWVSDHYLVVYGS